MVAVDAVGSHSRAVVAGDAEVGVGYAGDTAGAGVMLAQGVELGDEEGGVLLGAIGYWVRMCEAARVAGPAAMFVDHCYCGSRWWSI